MSYIGAQPTTAAFITDQFNGTGSQTAFTLSVAPATTSSILVSVSGVLQDPTTYAVSGTTLTFSAAPPSGTGNISVRFLGIPASGVATTAYRTVTEFTATAGQTSFSVPSYTAGYINVYRNGALLGTSDYTATSGTTVVLANPASSGDLVVTESFFVSSVLNAIPATNGAVTNPYILSMDGSKLTGTQVIPKATLPTGSVLQVQQSTSTTSFSTTSSTLVDSGISANFTPLYSSSKVLIIVVANCNPATGGSGFALYRGTTQIFSPMPSDGSGFYGIYQNIIAQTPLTYLDSPATTSSTTYRLYYASRSGNTSSIGGGGTTQFVFMEIAA